jgi:hypothetical protein
MVSERDVVGLLYRADWARLALSGTVTGAEPVLDTTISVQSDEPLSGPWQREDTDPPPEPPPGLFEHMPPWASRRMEGQFREAWRGKASGSSWNFEPNSQGAACSLAVAPGRRFRADGADGTWALGCDGARLWHWFRDLPAGTSVSFGLAGLQERPRPPYGALLAPSWLLTGYSLALGDEVTVAGRAGVQVRGTLRAVASQTTRIGGRPGRSVGTGGLFAPIPRWMNGFPDEVEAVIDLELGILLRCTKRSDDGPRQVTEFSSLDVPGRAEASVFAAPPGSGFGGGKGSRPRGSDGGQSGASSGAAGSSLGDALGGALETAGKEAAKAVAGLAAGGLGALIRYAPRRQPADPFAQATAEGADPEAEMPADETGPDETGPDGPGDTAAPAPRDGGLPDEVLHLVYRNGLAVPPFRATLHQWFDAGAVLAAVPQSARGTGFGGVGFLLDAVRDRAQETAAGASHEVSAVRMGSWTEYRIDVTRPNSDRARTMASDGTLVWHVFADRVVTGPAAPPPGDLADLVDASWLLDADLELSGGTEVTVGGRRAYRVVARHREDARPGTGWWERLFFPAVAVVDAETGLLLRLTRFKGGRPAIRQELRDLTALDAGTDFGFTPPAGLPVHQAGSPPGESEAGSWAWSRDPAFWAWGPRR